MLVSLCVSSAALADTPSPQGELLAKEGSVEFTGPNTNWVTATVGLKLMVQDRLRTLALSRATLRLAELGRLRVNELTTLEILPPTEAAGKATLDLRAGAVYFFTRDKPREFLLQTPHAIGASRGTEFLAVVEPGARTVLTVFDGEVELSNPQGSLVLTNGEQGTVQPSQAPVKTPAIQARNVVQWWLYYPGVLDLQELPLAPAEQTALAASLSAYTSGDLLKALENYPVGRAPQSDAERIYYAGLLLAVGQVEQTETLLAGVDAQSPFAAALREVVAAVTKRPLAETRQPKLATEWLARSYSLQATNLEESLQSARAAVEVSPSFGFAWARVAELEFCFGRINDTRKALNEALTLSPRNAQALALRGFVLSAQNRINEAVVAFEQAIEIDGALGNAWLGRGLCRIRKGDAEGGRRDLETAAALEPNRSLLHSYLGKAFSNANDDGHAEKELALARRLDPEDPTSWLYSALLNFQLHRINEAVDDLEKSVELNDNRRVYRSRLLLDQDLSVRSASLATIYQQAGMADVSVREASRAVTYDYANYSAHLFLANSLDALRDPTRFNLRYETAWFNELLLANLLSPVGAGTFSQNISQQEYARLFEVDRMGIASTSDARSDGQYREVASQYGTFGHLSYSLDLDWQHNDGVRQNNELERTEWYSQIKLQVTPQDSLFVLTKYQDYHSGDNFQHLNPNTSYRTNFNFDENQSPIAVGAYHHEWSPGVHTLFLGGRLINDQHLSDTPVPLLVVATNSNNQTLARPSDFDVNYRSDLEIYTAELNQIIESSRNTVVFGVRYQTGQFDTHSTQVNLDFPPSYFTNTDTKADSDFHHFTAYAYDTLEIIEHLLLTGGVAYDDLRFPRNYRQVPISEGEDSQSQVSPKAALVWNPVPEVTVRGIYTRSLGGVSLDESYRLEPVQLGGFSQAFRTLIPESVSGSLSAPTFETAGGALDLKFKTRTYIGLQGEWLKSDVDRSWGVYDYDQTATASVIPQQLRFEEWSAGGAVNQLVGNDWSFGAQYRFVRDELRTTWPSLDPSVNPGFNNKQTSDLQWLAVYGLFNHPSGFFARAEGNWYWQSSSLRTNIASGQNITFDLPNENFVQVNCFVGYRFPRQHGQISVGVLNVNNSDYHLNPLNVYAELPRERVLFGRVQLNF